jgi:tetratricopeptide (TPR) repeat protein
VRHAGLLLLLSSLALSAATWAQADDFDPHGRHHPPRPGGGHAPHGGGGAHPGGVAPGGDAGSAAARIDRATHIVLARPDALSELQKLAQLYRDRDGNIAKLVVDFEGRAAQAGPQQYAATVALAGLYKLDGRTDDAIATYERAIPLKSGDPLAILALALLHQNRGDLAPARQAYERALPMVTDRSRKEDTLRTLRGIALDQKDWDAAKKYHEQVVALEPTALFVKGELGHELYNRGEFQRAEAELKEVVTAAAGDNRALAPALKELGQAQAKAHENADALATLKRALAAAGPQSALRAEIYGIVAEIYRADQQLPVLIRQLEDEHPNDFARLALLGGLYEETGDSVKAIAEYKRALGIEPRQIDIRLRMIRLLQANGDLDKAIAEYDALIRSVPDNPQFVFEECEALLQRGDHARALKLVTDLEARAANDEEVLSRVADFYARIGESEKSLKVLERLAQTASADPSHIVDLGDHYYQDGNKQLAVQTWKRILAVVQPRQRALAALGDVYLEHDMVTEALAAYKEALQLEPGDLALQKSLASAYERNHDYSEAEALYQQIVAKAKEKGDRMTARECRTRIVALWGLQKSLDRQLPSLRSAFGATPPDVEAGRMLAEAQVHLRKLGDAEATLRRIIELAPGDVESYLALERVLAQEAEAAVSDERAKKIGEAIAVLEKLAEVEPKRARELYERMAMYAQQIYRDDDAIKYAARAVALNPDDAEGHRRLGEMYRAKQDTERAIAEFRAAITKNDRLFIVYRELADLLVSRGETDEADRLFRRVVRGAPDEDLVAQAARLSMQINLGKGTLESLEQDLLPLAIGNPQRPIYRRLLVEIYGSLTFGLVQRVRHGSPSEADAARAALARIGSRAVKPLLDALADRDASQQRIAIDVLAYVQNKNAAAPLFAYATGAADMTLRTRAMIACGTLGEADLVPKVEGMLFPKEHGDGRSPASGEPGRSVDEVSLADPVALAAVWGLARSHDARALPLLRRVARGGGTPEMRSLAVLGMGMADDRSSIAAIAEIARSVDAGNVARAAAAYALGELDARAQVPELLEMAEEGDALPRRMALMALARITRDAGKDATWQGEAVQAMADAAFADTPEGARGKASAESIARAAVAALAAMAKGPAPKDGKSAGAGREALPVPEGALDIDALLDALVPREVPAADREATFLRFSKAVRAAAQAALRTSGERARAVLDALGTGDGELEPFVSRGGSEAAVAEARAVMAALEPSIVPLARHPDPDVRTKALVLASRFSSDAAMAAVVSGLEDSSEGVQRVALSAIAGERADGKRVPATPQAVQAVARVMATHESWALRVLAARAMGRLGAAGAAAEAAQRLEEVATKDTYALVRQAALESMASFDRARARELAARMASSDPEPRVREAAKEIASREK